MKSKTQFIDLSADQASLLRGRRYNRTKKKHGGKREPSRQNDDLKTAYRLAAQHGVSHGTIERDGAFATAVDKVKAANDGGKGTPKATGGQNVPRLKSGEALAVQHGGKREPRGQNDTLKSAEKLAAQQGVDRNFWGVQNAPPKTADRLAAQHGVSRDTIKRDGAFATAVENVKAADPEIERKVIE